jgi:hypothetical protein
VSSILRRCLTIQSSLELLYPVVGKRGNEKETQKIVFNRIGAGSVFVWLFWDLSTLLSRSLIWECSSLRDRSREQEVGKRFVNERTEGGEGRGVVGEVYSGPVMKSYKPKLTWQPARYTRSVVVTVRTNWRDTILRTLKTKPRTTDEKDNRDE